MAIQKRHSSKVGTFLYHEIEHRWEKSESSKIESGDKHLSDLLR